VDSSQKLSQLHVAFLAESLKNGKLQQVLFEWSIETNQFRPLVAGDSLICDEAREYVQRSVDSTLRKQTTIDIESGKDVRRALDSLGVGVRDQTENYTTFLVPNCSFVVISSIASVYTKSKGVVGFGPEFILDVLCDLKSGENRLIPFSVKRIKKPLLNWCISSAGDKLYCSENGNTLEINRSTLEIERTYKDFEFPIVSVNRGELLGFNRKDNSVELLNPRTSFPSVKTPEILNVYACYTLSDGEFLVGAFLENPKTPGMTMHLLYINFHVRNCEVLTIIPAIGSIVGASRSDSL
jgi:hypothetical protein